MDQETVDLRLQDQSNVEFDFFLASPRRMPGHLFHLHAGAARIFHQENAGIIPEYGFPFGYRPRGGVEDERNDSTAVFAFPDFELPQ